MFFSQTYRTNTGPRITTFRRRMSNNEPRVRQAANDDPDVVMRDFQNMLGNMMGPAFRPGQSGRSGQDTLFTSGPFGGGEHSAFGGGPGGRVVGGRFTFSTGPIRPRNADGAQPSPHDDPVSTYDSLPFQTRLAPAIHIGIRARPDQLPSLLGGLFGPMGSQDQDHNHDHRAGPPGLPPGLQQLFAAMLNPANARSGDAVYSQEALDQIISTLMEQHPTSNAPGPAPPDAIASLVKKKLDEQMLGPDPRRWQVSGESPLFTQDEDSTRTIPGSLTLNSNSRDERPDGPTDSRAGYTSGNDVLGASRASRRSSTSGSQSHSSSSGPISWFRERWGSGNRRRD
jgi:E3 ubiquitin-protein ligase RNF115/126